MHRKLDGVTTTPSDVDDRVLESLRQFPISTTERLSIRGFDPEFSSNEEKSPLHQTLLIMNNLRTLVLNNCFNSPFVLALNPKEDPFGTVLCPKLEKLEVYVGEDDALDISELLEMARWRASEGVKLEHIVIVSTEPFTPVSEVLGLRRYVRHVEYKLDNNATPSWDHVPGLPDIVE